MNNIINNSFYYLRKINCKILLLILSILTLFTALLLPLIQSIFSFSDDMLILNQNAWDTYLYIYNFSPTVSTILPFISLYFIFSCFCNEKLEYYIKIRTTNKATWFFSKIFIILFFNLFLISFHTLITLIIGVFNYGIGFTWSDFGKELWIGSPLYSPLKIAVINILTYTFLISFLAEIIGILIIKIRKRVIVLIGVIIYIIGDIYIGMFNGMLGRIFKYISINNYLNFGNRTLYLSQNTGNFTVIQSVIYPLIFFIILTFIIFKIYNKANTKDVK